MKCPSCQKEMAEMDFGGVKVDVCSKGCRGIWFDQLELRKLDEKGEGSGPDLKAMLSSPRATEDEMRRLVCPKCDLLMFSHAYSADKKVKIDECYQCGGIFLDAGELKLIRG